MSDEKFEVLSTHELIQAQHMKHKAGVLQEQLNRKFKDQEGNDLPMKMDDMMGIKIMLQALMDKVKGLDAYVRAHCKELNKPTTTLNAKREVDPMDTRSQVGHVKDEFSHPLNRVAQFPADTTEEDFQRGEGQVL